MQTNQAWIPTNMDMSDATMIDLGRQHGHVNGRLELDADHRSCLQ